MKNTVHTTFIQMLTILLMITAATCSTAGDYPLVDTGQNLFFDNTTEISSPSVGENYYGQDAQYNGRVPDFFLSADGLSAEDSVTGLTWQRSPDTNLDGSLEPVDKLSWWDALAQPDILNSAQFGGYADWRLPNIKELYSLIDFSGIDPSGYEGNTAGLVPFLDTEVFEFIYGDESLQERIIDSQYWTTSEYVSTTMNGDHTVFGVNFADGRIKGYGTSLLGTDKTAFVLCVRGNSNYALNEFVNNSDGTITDQATNLMWMQDDNGDGLNWQAALDYAENLVFAQYDDWRLPNTKELQSILDYSRSPATHGSAAIDPMFTCSTIVDEGGETNFPCYWTGTTHMNWTTTPGSQAVYVAFGEALGWMRSPFPPFAYTLLDVHGAGSQRSDPKAGDPADYPYGHGPQGDTIRIYNHVRCVRDTESSSGVGDDLPAPGMGYQMENFPNPFNPFTEVVFTVPGNGKVLVNIYDAAGAHVKSLLNEVVPAGKNSVRWTGVNDSGRPVPSGLYFAKLSGPTGVVVNKMILAK